MLPYCDWWLSWQRLNALMIVPRLCSIAILKHVLPSVHYNDVNEYLYFYWINDVWILNLESTLRSVDVLECRRFAFSTFWVVNVLGMAIFQSDVFGCRRSSFCPACRTSLIATRFWVVVICPIIKCLTVLEFSFILFDLCLFITIFNFILNYVPIVTFWIFTYHKIWILLIIFCFIWNYWITYFFNMFGSVLECCELTGVSLLWPWLIKWK